MTHLSFSVQVKKMKHTSAFTNVEGVQGIINYLVQMNHDQMELSRTKELNEPCTKKSRCYIVICQSFQDSKINVSRWHFPLRGNQAARIFFVALVRVVGISPPPTAHSYMNPSQGDSCSFTPKLRKVSAGFGG